MKELYSAGNANYPRLKTDKHFVDFDNRYSYDGFIDKSFRYIEDFQLLDAERWFFFVEQFREHTDIECGWRGEYWGKMMRGASFVYSYTQNEKLYAILEKTVSDMMESVDEYGRISSYPYEIEFGNWDMWCRKYVLLGMQYFLEICNDEVFAKKVVASMCAQLDYIISKIGDEKEGKLPVVKATKVWRGLNSSSILEPVVRLYNITGKKEYFDFAQHIVDNGFCQMANIIDLAFENKAAPYQYPVTKAYEMTSCFEGLVEFYRVTGVEKYKQAVINFANKVLETDFTVIGCAGCTHELFDHSTVRQANPSNNPILQETCVTVTLMKFMYQLNILTGDAKYADAFEISLYNAYLGSINTEKGIEEWTKTAWPGLNYFALPFISSSPLTSAIRGTYVGGLRPMKGGTYYGCCACIGSAGIGLVPKMHLLSKENGFAVNLYINGTASSKTPAGNDITFVTRTEYPKGETVQIQLNLARSERFTVSFRNPSWSKDTKIFVNGQIVKTNAGYIDIEKEWNDGDVVKVIFDMRTRAIYPISYGSQLLVNEIIYEYDYVLPMIDIEDPQMKNHIALQRGPVMLAQDSRLGYDLEDAIKVELDKDGYVAAEFADDSSVPYEAIMVMNIPLANGKKMTVTDYASAGKLMNEKSKMAVWMKTE